MSTIGLPGFGDRSASQEAKVVLRCPTCKHSYRKVQAYDIHVVKCAQEHKERAWKLRRAFPLYQLWFAKSKRATPNERTFATSRFGAQFVKFIDWCDAMNVSSPEVYVRVMMDSSAEPSTWATVEAYKAYTKQFDHKCTVDQWLLITAATINTLCADRNIPTREFYRAITPNLLAHMLRTKSIYPRYLVCDPNFREYLGTIPKQFAEMISDAILDMYLQPNMDCDEVIKAVIAHLNE